MAFLFIWFDGRAGHRHGISASARSKFIVIPSSALSLLFFEDIGPFSLWSVDAPGYGGQIRQHSVVGRDDRTVVVF